MSLTGTFSPAGKGTKSAPETKVSGLPLRSTEDIRARLEIQNLGFDDVFCILFAAAGKKYAAGGICQPSKQVVRTLRTIRCTFVFLTCPQYCEKINSRNDNFFHNKMETFPVKTEKFCINCKLCEKVLYFFVESGN